MTKNLLIVGSDSSLGRELSSQGVFNGYNVIKYNSYTFEKLKNIRFDLDMLIGDRQIDYVINNWGINRLSHIGTTGWVDEDILHHNVMIPYLVIDCLVNNNQTCRVINVASATYRVNQRCTTLYSASKAALVQMTKVMARELAPKGWVINAVAPGKIEDTRMSELTDKQVLELRGWTEEQANDYAISNIPMGRFTTRKEVAEAIYLMFKMPAYVNGSVLDIMGGV